MRQDKFLKEIEQESARLYAIAKEHKWGPPRNPENYILLKREYSFGTRNYFSIEEKKYQLYKDLQCSRGMAGATDMSKEINLRIEDVEKRCHIFPRTILDSKRVKELDNQLDFDKIDSFFEIGFREPTLIEYYETKYDIDSQGCDVNNLSVMISQHLGYNVQMYDLNFSEKPFVLPKKCLVVAYHIFEHLISPLESLQQVYDAMDEESFLHIEVPIEERNIPNLRYGHLQTFYRQDLRHMLVEIGFQILHSDITENERHLVRK